MAQISYPDVMLKEAMMPPTENQPENRRGVPAEKRQDVKNPLQADTEGLENLDLTRPAPVDVERQEQRRPDAGK